MRFVYSVVRLGLHRQPDPIMLDKIPEPDWRQFKAVHEEFLQRHCQETLARLGDLLAAAEGTPHERYRRVYRLLEERDEEVAQLFDDFRRSTAVMQLMLMRRKGLLTDAELGWFSETTQRRVRIADEIRNAGSGTAKEGRPGGPG